MKLVLVCGGILPYLLCNGFEATIFNQFTVIAFRFTVIARPLILGIAYALAMGVLGGILPAVRVIRLPIAASLRQT